MNQALRTIYENHHQESRPGNFSILEKQRGDLFAQKIGVGKNVLDIGCRDGVLTKYFVEGNKVVGVDIDENNLTKAAKDLGIKTLAVDLNGDWQALVAEEFDIVVMGEVLEHLYLPKKVLEKVRLSLKTDGVLIGSVPNAFSLKNRIRYLVGQKKNTPLADPTHINHFSLSELTQILKSGFSEVEIIGLGHYSRLAKMFPGWFAFDLAFVAKHKI